MPPSHQTVRLSPGRHDDPEHGVCVMELASMLAGEPFSDRPRSVSPALASALRGYNDGLDDERRQGLKRFAAAAVGTAGGRTTEKRRQELIHEAMGGGAPATGLRAALARLFDATGPYRFTRAAGLKVAAGDDEVLHHRMLGLLDALVDCEVLRAPVAEPCLHHCPPTPRTGG